MRQVYALGAELSIDLHRTCGLEIGSLVF